MLTCKRREVTCQHWDAMENPTSSAATRVPLQFEARVQERRKVHQRWRYRAYRP